ncbi:N-acetyltransferase [Stackebrandtia soli]|uniref:N-acetyltransferase n=1 Tax=Stackebrandtia soli TaxID=1892856 RepID=UPI0039EC4905
MDLTITTLADRPELADALWTMPDDWPAFLLEDPVSWSHFPQVVANLPQYVLVATDDADGSLVARALSVPFGLMNPGRGSLPGTGWDQVLMWGISDHRHGRPTDMVSALEIAIRIDARGKGLSSRMLAAMRDNARAHGFTELVAPIRPTSKHLHPDMPMAEYAQLTRDDGLPVDPWIRTHVRAGAVIDSVAPASMTVSGSLDQWRQWTELPFDEDGPVIVPGGLSPVRCDLANDYAVYVEANLWVRHRLD